MITFTRIRWKNLLSSGDVWIDIPLNVHNTTLIIGDNGAGKSTLIEALCLVLYNQGFRKVNKGQLVNSINKKGLLVEIWFEINGINYMVRRGMKPNVFEIYKNDVLLDATADDQSILEKQILKMNYKSFLQIVVLGSALFVPFMKLQRGPRREIIDDLLDIQIFSVMSKLHKDDVTENTKSIAEIDSTMRSLADQIQVHIKHLERLKVDNSALIVQKQEEITQHERDLLMTEIELAAQRSVIEDLKHDLIGKDAAVAKVRELEGKFNAIAKQIATLKKSVQYYKTTDKCNDCQQRITTEFKNGMIERLQPEIDTLQAQYVAFSDEAAALSLDNKKYYVTEQALQKFQTSTHQLQARLDVSRGSIQYLQADVARLTKTDHIDSTADQISALKASLREQLEQKATHVNKKALLEIAGTLLKDTGIKTRVIAQYIPIMNSLINKYLAALDFFVAFELDENFNETIKSRFRDEFTYESFSEGEKMRIDLALLFTWRAIAKLRNSASTNLLIMDEVLDGALDGIGTEEFMKIVNNLTADTNTIIISHKVDQMFDKFTKVLRFEKHRNFSQVS